MAYRDLTHASPVSFQDADGNPVEGSALLDVRVDDSNGVSVRIRMDGEEGGDYTVLHANHSEDVPLGGQHGSAKATGKFNGSDLWILFGASRLSSSSRKFRFENAKARQASSA